MLSDFKFSIVIPNSSGYRDSIESVISQTLDFNENTQIIIVEKDKDIVLDIDDYLNKYPNNFILLENQDGEIINHAGGEFVNFMQAGDRFDNATLKLAYESLTAHPDINLISIPLYDDIYAKATFNLPLIEDNLINLNNIKTEEFDYYHLPIFSSFIKKSKLMEYDFKPEIMDENAINVISRILIDDMRFIFLKNVFCHHEDKGLFSQNINFENVMGKLDILYGLIEYSNDKLNKTPEFLQHIIAKELESIIRIEEVSEISKDHKQLDLFWARMDDILSNISMKSVENNNFLDKFTMSFILFLKNKDFKLDYSNHKVFFKTRNYIMSALHNHQLFFDVVEIRNSVLNLSGSIKSICYDENIKIKAILEDKDGDIKYFEGKFVEYPTTNRRTVKFLSNPWIFSHNVDFKIPLKSNETQKIKFMTEYCENKEYVVWENRINCKKYSHLSKFSHYLIKDEILVLFKENSFFAMPLNEKQKLKFDLRAMLEIIKQRPPHFINGLKYRSLIMLLYPFWKKRKIWIFMDRLDFADDNAEHLFKYALNQKDDVEKYYVLDKNASDFKRLSKSFKNIVPFGSLKHKLLFLFSQKVVSSQPAVSLYNPFFTKNITLFAGFYPDVYFLQHGVTKDNISSWLHKFNRNLALISTTSDLERESFLDVGYNYDEEIIQTLGFTRYDNLSGDNTKKQIVIMPSWRNYIKNEDDLINSEYFKRWNSLINNEEFIEYARKKGYEIIFKPHLNLYKFIDLFDKNEHVTVDHVKKYQEIFNESALLITDYSSIFFDFAYIKKPLIFYQYANDYHFDSENGYFNYETMGFGEVIRTEDEIVKKIKFYLDCDCTMEDSYKKRVDDFFKHTDKKNCKRTYDWIYKN